jgi:hypothetical protein
MMDAMAALPVPWPTPEFPLAAATWSAVGIELFVIAWAGWVLWRHRANPVATTREWFERLSIGSFLAILAWAPLCCVGAWVVAMAVEDQVALYALELAAPAGWCTALIVGWRLGWTGLQRVATRLPQAEHRWQGWMAAPPVLLVTGLALRHGLPIHGWLA